SFGRNLTPEDLSHNQKTPSRNNIALPTPLPTRSSRVSFGSVQTSTDSIDSSYIDEGYGINLKTIL
ncbi:hypothetical protein BGZ80_006514, partial [Entomortierella chlamydospora]